MPFHLLPVWIVPGPEHECLMILEHWVKVLAGMLGTNVYNPSQVQRPGYKIEDVLESLKQNITDLQSSCHRHSTHWMVATTASYQRVNLLVTGHWSCQSNPETSSLAGSAQAAHSGPRKLSAGFSFSIRCFLRCHYYGSWWSLSGSW